MSQHIEIALKAIRDQIEFHKSEIEVLEKVEAQLRGGAAVKRRPGRPPASASAGSSAAPAATPRRKRRPAWTPERRAKMMKIFAARKANRAKA